VTKILIIKTAALGDVLRTTSILPGLHARYPGCEVTWVTSAAAASLVAPNALNAGHSLVASIVRYPALPPPMGGDTLPEPSTDGSSAWDRVLSFDDEAELCRVAFQQAGRQAGVDRGVLSGAYEDADGRLRYTPDTAEWFGMGLLSEHGKERADELKKQNQRTHPEIYASMLGIEMGEPDLFVSKPAADFAREFSRRTGLHGSFPLIGFNTGAGGRWESKKLSVAKTIEVACALHERLGGKETILLLGGRDEAERNAAILAGIGDGAQVVDAGTDNTMHHFAALIDRLDLLLTSDSLAMHVGIARKVPIVAFFAPTSAAEIELYGRGEKVVSTAPDYCTYRPVVDTDTLTVERIVDAVMRNLPATSRRRG
jgi:heptosyltransferase-2